MMHPKVWIKFGSQRLTVAQAALRIGISSSGLWNRLERGVPRDMLLRPGYGPRQKTYATPFEAALDGAITADEYLAEEAKRDKPC